MHKKHIKKLGLLLKIDEILSKNKQNFNLLSKNFKELGISEKNIIFTYIENKNIEEIKKVFYKIFDTHTIAAADSAKISENYKEGKYGCDREFLAYINLVKNNSAETLAKEAFEKLIKLKETDPSYYDLLTIGSRFWYMGANWLDGAEGENNSLIINRMNTLTQNAERLEWLYENLADSLSRRSLNAIIKFWLTWDYSDWLKLSLYYCDVVDTQIFPFYDNEVFVDCGSYIGDTVLQYANTVNNKHKRIYTYDISSASIREMNKNLENLSNVVIRHSGTGDKNTNMDMIGLNQPHGGNRLATEEASPLAVERVKVVRLDDDINEEVTFLKIDVEGMDKETLIGAKNIVEKYHPKLNVDAYHKLEDIVDVPWLIRQIDENYVLYLRLPMLLEYQPRFPFATFMAI